MDWGGNENTPSDWVLVSDKGSSALYEHDKRGLEVEIRAVFRGSKAKSKNRDPTHFVVQLHQDWFSRGTIGEKQMSAKVETLERARTVAQEFMREFSREVQDTPIEEIEATHRSAEDHQTADQILTRTASAEALADAAGYSDDLFREVLSAETNGKFLLAIHRDGDDIYPIEGEAESLLEDGWLSTLYAAFPVDKLGIDEILADETPVIMMVHLDDLTIYRFIFSDRRESDIILPRGTQITSPAFENTIGKVLEEKW